MSDSIYRIPTTGVFLRSDGMVVPKPQDVTNVSDASPELAQQLTAAYVGKGLQLLNADDLSFGGWANDYYHLGIGSTAQRTLRYIIELTDTIVLVGDAVELGVKIADWWGCLVLRILIL